MKKKYLWPVLLIVSLVMVLGGCKKPEPIAAEKAATLFINRFVYEKDSEEFEKNFKDSQELKEVMTKNTQNFKDNFLAGLTSTSISEKTADELFATLFQQVQKKTSYAVEVKAENDETAQIVYHVTGIDFPQLIKKTDEDLLAAIQKNTSIAKDNEKLMQTIIEILQKNLKDLKVKTQPTEITVTFAKDKDQWVIPQDQSEKISNLYLAFISGAKNQEELNSQLDKVAEDVNNALKAQLK